MGWLIAYDIADAKRWRKVYHLVRSVGFRLQYSLFWADIDAQTAHKLADELKSIIDPKADDIRFYPLDDDDEVLLAGPKPWPEGTMHAAARRFDRCWRDVP